MLTEELCICDRQPPPNGGGFGIYPLPEINDLLFRRNHNRPTGMLFFELLLQSGRPVSFAMD